MKSKKELINRGREIASNLLKHDPRQGYRFETIYELCDALEEHEPKPIIRKGEVYAYKSLTTGPGWHFGAALKEMPVGRDKSSATDRRKLTAEEMPLPEEN